MVAKITEEIEQKKRGTRSKKPRPKRDARLARQRREINRIFKNGNFIPILDKDPVNAARSLVFSHLKNAIDAISVTLAFANINPKISDNEIAFFDSEFKKKSVFRDILRTAGNVRFYSIMYEELQKIHYEVTGYYRKVIPEFKEEYLYGCNFQTKTKPPTIRPIEEYLPYNSYYSKRYKEYLYKRVSPINGYRRIYLHEGYTLDKFPAGAPPWYSPCRVVVYQKYDIMSRKTIKITTDINGHYRYFMAYITDKWIEIENVPPEMRDVIDSILLQRKI